MEEIIFIDIELVYKIHNFQISRYGGSFGIRDIGLLESAINMPKSYFSGTYLYPTIYHMAAAYLFYIIKNHAFVDGNKRTGVLAAITFLGINDIKLTVSNEQFIHYTLKMITNELSIEELASIFVNNSISL